MSFTKSAHLSELNHYRLKLRSVLHQSTIDKELNIIVNKDFENKESDKE